MFGPSAGLRPLSPRRPIGRQRIESRNRRGEGSVVQARTADRLAAHEFFRSGAPSFASTGIPDVTHFPFVTLRRIIAHRLQAGGDYVFGYQHIAGYPPLKRAIARYLAAARGVRCEPDQVVITNGAQPAFDLLARILTDPEDCVWMEDPGYPAAQSAFVAAGATIMALPVSMEGWELSAPPEDGTSGDLCHAVMPEPARRYDAPRAEVAPG